MDALVCHKIECYFEVLSHEYRMEIHKKVREIVPQMAGALTVNEVLRLLQNRPRGNNYSPPEPFTSLKAEVECCMFDLVFEGVLRMSGQGRMYLAPRIVK